MNAPFEREYTSTLTPEQGALYPKNSTTTPAETTETTESPTIERGYDSAPVLTPASTEIVERRLNLATPELVEQVELEEVSLDAWVAFKVHDHFVQDIYAGLSTEVDPKFMQDYIVLPAYQAEQQQYLKDSAHIIGKQVPKYKQELAYNQADLVAAEAVINGHNGMGITPSEQSLINEALKTQRISRKNIQDIEQSIANAHLRAQVKDAVFARINRLLTTDSEEVVAARVDKVTQAARKEAYNEVIQDLEGQRPRVKLLGSEDDLKAHDRRIATLKAELEAYEGVAPVDLSEPATQEEAPTTQEDSVKRTHILGSFGLALGSLRAVFAK